jgi:hypothetical protein
MSALGSWDFPCEAILIYIYNFPLSMCKGFISPKCSAVVGFEYKKPTVSTDEVQTANPLAAQ